MLKILNHIQICRKNISFFPFRPFSIVPKHFFFFISRKLARLLHLYFYQYEKIQKCNTRSHQVGQNAQYDADR